MVGGGCTLKLWVSDVCGAEVDYAGSSPKNKKYEMDGGAMIACHFYWLLHLDFIFCRAIFIF